MSKRLKPYEILALPMDSNGSGATTIRGYLVALLAKVWRDQEGFSGKRPFGNSSWAWDLHLPLVKAGQIEGSIDEDGYLEDCDDSAGDELIAEAIQHLSSENVADRLASQLAALGGSEPAGSHQ